MASSTTTGPRQLVLDGMSSPDPIPGTHRLPHLRSNKTSRPMEHADTSTSAGLDVKLRIVFDDTPGTARLRRLGEALFGYRVQDANKIV